jgi:NitT/TauT family transport system substrate-binding protein
MTETDESPRGAPLTASRRRLLALLAGVAGGGALAACAPRPAAAPAAAPAGAPAAPANSPATLKVGILNIIPITPLRTAVKLDYFKEVGLDVQVETFAGGALAFPALLNKQIDIVYTNYISAVQLADQGGKLRIVAGGNASLGTEPDSGTLLVGPDSDVRSLRDLPGRTIALNTLNDLIRLTIKKLLRDTGIDPASVNYTEVPWQNQADAYKQGSIQVLSVIEPFQTRYVTQLQFRPLSYIFPAAWKTSIPLAGWVALEEWVPSHREPLQRFARVLERSVQYLKANPAEERKLMAEFFNFSEELVAGVSVNTYSVKVDPAAAQLTVDAMVEDGMIKNRVSFESLLYDTAR